MELLPFQESNCSLFPSKSMPAEAPDLGLMSSGNELMKDITEHKEKEMAQGWQDIMDLGEDFMDIGGFDYLKDNDVLLSLDELPPVTPIDPVTPITSGDNSIGSVTLPSDTPVPIPVTTVANHVANTVVNTVAVPMTVPMANTVANTVAVPIGNAVADVADPVATPKDIPEIPVIPPISTPVTTVMGTSEAGNAASSIPAPVTDVPMPPSSPETLLPSPMDTSKESTPENLDVAMSPPVLDVPACNDSNQTEPMEDQEVLKDVASVSTNTKCEESSAVNCKTSHDLHTDISSTSPDAPTDMWPWTVTSFWVSPDVHLKECSVRLKKLEWPADDMMSGQSDEDEDMESLGGMGCDEVGQVNDYDNDDNEDDDEDDIDCEVQDDDEDNGEEWMILKAEASTLCKPDEDVTNTSSCLTRLLLKKCRHNSSSNESQESGHKTTEKTLMLDAYHNQDIDSKTLSDHELNTQPAKSESNLSSISTTSSSETLPQPSFSNLLEQCLRQSKANQPKHQVQNDHESDSASVRQLPCSLCTKTFDNIEGLCQHIRHHPPLDSPPKLPLLGFRCPLCWEKFPVRSLLVGHMLYTCQTSYEQPKPKGLVKATEMYYCEKCLQGFPSLKVASGHARYTCKPRKPERGYSDLDDEQVVIAHLFNTSPNVSKSRLLRVEEFRCPQCRLRFPTASIAESHLRHTCVFNILHILI